MFSRLGAFCVRRRGLVVIAWLVVLVGLGAFSGAVGSNFSTEFGMPDVESKRGLDVLDEHMGGEGTGLEGTIVFQSEDGFEDPALRAEIDEFLDGFITAGEEFDLDVTVTSPFEEQAPPSPALIDWYTEGTDDPAVLESLAQAGSGNISEDGTIAFATISVPGDTDVETAAEWAGGHAESAAPESDGLRTEYGGDVFMEFEAPAAELIGLAFAIVILILAFGSVLAMGLPIGTALAGIGIGSVLLTLLSNLITMPDFATILGVMIGLGVGIDYALFIVTRYREQLRTHTVEEAVAIAIDTSGRAVTFAGLTVVISLLGMLLMGVSFVTGLGLGAATMVLVTMVGSLTLLPALLGFAGTRVEVTRWRGLISAGFVAVALLSIGLKATPLVTIAAVSIAILVLIVGFFAPVLRREVPRRPEKPLRETFAYRWSRFVQARPWTLAIGSTLLLVILALPVFGIRLGFSDAGNLPEDSSGHQAYDLLSDGFGVGSNGRLLLVAEVPDDLDASTAEPFLAVTAAVAATPGVESVSPPFPSNQENPSESEAVLWQVQPTTSPQDEATGELVKEIRENVLPEATAGTGMDVLVTGFVSLMVDFSDYLASRLFLFFAVVLTVSFLLLMAVFRSLLVPLKAVIMNLLSIGAAYGVIVAIFQWGWAKDIFGVEPAPIEPFMPMMLFAIVFGLSMDYEVFLLSRVREEWLKTGDSHTSVADGLAATARVITAAAAIMIVVFGSFLLETDRLVKLMGFGLALAVLLDATIVRMLLVPATMELLGDKNWWLPKWLDRLLPTLNVEGHIEDEQAPEPDREEALV